jgi:hypothetical protein
MLGKDKCYRLFGLFVSDDTRKGRFITLKPGSNVITLFTAVIYECP